MTRFALLCYDTVTRRVTRYVRNPHGKVWDTHTAVLDEIGETTVAELEQFRQQPVLLPVRQPEPQTAA